MFVRTALSNNSISLEFALKMCEKTSMNLNRIMLILYDQNIQLNNIIGIDKNYA